MNLKCPSRVLPLVQVGLATKFAKKIPSWCVPDSFLMLFYQFAVSGQWHSFL